MEEQLILDNINLIYKVINDMNLYWNNDDEYQDFYDSGLIGLIEGCQTYDESKGYKISTYLYVCIKREILKYIVSSNSHKRKINKIVKLSLESNLKNKNNEVFKKQLFELIPDPNIDIESKAIDDEQLQIIIHAIQQLTDRNREILCKYYGLFGYEKYLQRELAKQYNISISAIGHNIRNSIEKIKKIIKESE